MNIHQKITYPFANQSSEYLPQALQSIEDAHMEGVINDVERKKLQITAWRRFFLGYVQIILMSVSQLVTTLILGLLAEGINMFVPARYNLVFQLYRWITRHSIIGEYGVEQAAYEAGIITHSQFETRAQSLHNLYLQSIEGIRLSEPDTWDVRQVVGGGSIQKKS